jgi:hypothetical protein
MEMVGKERCNTLEWLWNGAGYCYRYYYRQSAIMMWYRVRRWWWWCCTDHILKSSSGWKTDTLRC